MAGWGFTLMPHQGRHPAGVRMGGVPVDWLDAGSGVAAWTAGARTAGRCAGFAAACRWFWVAVASGSGLDVMIGHERTLLGHGYRQRGGG